MRRTAFLVIAGIVGVTLAQGGCTTSNDRLGYIDLTDPNKGFVPVDPPDAATPDSGDELIVYCASNRCPVDRTTCASSRFACDVNLMTDPRNCGECGVDCGYFAHFRAAFDCVEGTCVKRCQDKSADCNGFVDDGCEVELGTNDNCNACGDRCPDPKKPCFFDTSLNKGQCGCDPGLEYCGACIDPKIDDLNCGGCGVVCDPAGDGGTPRDHAYYGCVASECGHLKCQPNYASCDGDLTNGCETYVLSADNCGACGKACDPGQTCILDLDGQALCACPAGQTLCGRKCVDLLTDKRNCGTCATDCTNRWPDGTGNGFCSGGACEYGCAAGRGDCNGDSTDGCETNFASDPRNCGACGNTCDLAAGQPCVQGRCVVEACDGGVVTR
jgi:hypothetical protein